MKGSRLLKLLFNPRRILIAILQTKSFKVLPDKLYVKLLYFFSVGEKLNFNHLVTYYQKINWLKFNYKDDLLKICSDKYTVREYIRRKVGDQVLVPLYGIFTNAKDINFNQLPDSYILKITTGNGRNIICEDNGKIDKNKTIKLLNKWLKDDDYYWRGREWCYKDSNPKIICEKFLNVNGIVPKDYKVYCFHGKPAYIAVFHDRFGKVPSQTVYDINWNALPCVMDYHFKRNINDIEPKPVCYDQILSISEKVSEAFIHVRVDFYIVNEKPFIGELTFFNASGCTKMLPQEWDVKIGSLIDLVKISKNGKYIS